MSLLQSAGMSQLWLSPDDCYEQAVPSLGFLGPQANVTNRPCRTSESERRFFYTAAINGIWFSNTSVYRYFLH